MPFRFIDHTGDTAVELEAPGEAELFQEAARALLALFRGSASAGEEESREIELESEDGEALLVDFLNELIFRFDADGFLCARVEVAAVTLGEPARLEARLLGEVHRPGAPPVFTEVKAATFHGVKIERRHGTLHTLIVFDL